MPATLDDTPTLHILIELLKEGKAGIFPELEEFEPISQGRLVQILNDRAGKNLGPDFEPWYRWFLEDCNEASDEDREKLKIARRLIEDERKYVERITNKRRRPNQPKD
jgi:hypothetical protein